MLKEYLFLGLTIFLVITQVPHVYYTFDSFSRLKGTWRKIQSGAFCAIISISIIGFVWIGRPELALLGAIIEIIVNLYYYSIDFWRNGPTRRKEASKLFGIAKKDIGTFWRENWIAFLFGSLIPLAIYLFSEILIKL
jgi:hypothetical protein